MSASEGAVGIDVGALKRFVSENPEEFQRLLGNAAITMEDRYGRTISKSDRVITPAGETGLVIRVDKKSKRVLIELPDGKTRLLMAHRVEVKRGRPRKDSLRAVAIA